MRPRIALTLGDPAGIGPELVARLLALEETAARADVVVVGDRWLLARGAEIAGVALDLPEAEPGRAGGDRPALLALATVREDEVAPGEASAAGGRAALAALRRALALAAAGEADAVVFAPLNKHALHLAGFGFEDELRWAAAELGYRGYVTELNVVDDLWTSRVTSHVPLADVAGLITEEGIIDAVALIDGELRRAGVERPRIGVAALNPHAGDGGNFGREEIDLIGPAVERARAAGHDARGPYPADTVFVRARDGQLDAVVTMYHDQGQIATKLLGFGRGVTVLGGLPVPIATCGHGTAYDIVGRGVAGVESLRRAFLIAARMGESRRGAAQAGEVAAGRR